MINLLFTVIGVILGGILAYGTLQFTTPVEKKESLAEAVKESFTKKQIIGFLPFWLLSKANSDYSAYMTTLTYFGLTIDGDGSILKMTNRTESEPGWHTLNSGKADDFLTDALKKDMTLSLLLFMGDEESIAALIDEPVTHAQKLMKEVTPIMKKHKFTDLNIDIESVKLASESSRKNFTIFMKEIKNNVDENNLGTVTVDVTGGSFYEKRLTDPVAIAPYVDYLVIMAYDYHYIGSSVTGAVAPLFGAGKDSEYDVNEAVRFALNKIPPEKVILGVPLYGYEWETIRDIPRAGIIPSSGLTASTKRVEELLGSCTECKTGEDRDAREKYVIFPDDSGSFHQIFYPDATSTVAKIDYAREKKLGGLAFWALGYEDSEILLPLKEYK